MSELYLVTDTDMGCRAGHTVPYIVEEACRAGVRWVQLREKTASTRAFVELAGELKRITQMYGARLIINDRVDVALAVDADGVHVGQDDMPHHLVRKLIGLDKILGLSVNNLTELQEAKGADIDYLGVAAIFPTATKQDTSSLLGLEGLREICRQTRLPTFAIGGINAGNIRDVMRAGATGAAVVSAICGHPSPYEAARELSLLMSE
ncbi:thiamine-phosphate pyrophosphorylase [Larkinella arboricola]|uniref:Thiamine-phosphate synthase n=1 Tax=Larkinella arboricola TaxID=643671 RepID=A0A327WT38_LARAB|nr:thiamine phosphate synthase [Larkinella arboricola]RAJ95494.1 thiamine-phosphate pyrophosphorylase [Larkinella arboricola]